MKNKYRTNAILLEHRGLKKEENRREYHEFLGEIENHDGSNKLLV